MREQKSSMSTALGSALGQKGVCSAGMLEQFTAEDC